MFLAAVALPCLVLYHRAVVATGPVTCVRRHPDPSRADFLTRAHMAAPPPPPLSVTRAAAPDHLQQHQGHGGAGAEVRRAAKALMFLAAVSLPCLVLYHRAVVPSGDLLGAAAMPWSSQPRVAPAPAR